MKTALTLMLGGLCLMILAPIFGLGAAAIAGLWVSIGSWKYTLILLGIVLILGKK